MSKHKPETRDEFRQLVLRKLGAPMIQINVSEETVEDCIEEGLKYYADYHYDGTEHVYYTHTLTATDITNRYITVPDELIGVTEVYGLTSQSYTLSSADMFNGGYMVALDFAFGMTNGSMLSFFMNKQAYEFLNQMIIGLEPLRFNRHMNRVHFDFNWSRVFEGMVLVLDGYKKLDPELYTDVWNDRWLAKYVAAKIKYIWGGAMSKFEGVQLPGGVTLSGARMQDDAKEEISQLEDEMLVSYSLPPRDYIA